MTSNASPTLWEREDESLEVILLEPPILYRILAL
jgi:hypothetical protein